MPQTTQEVFKGRQRGNWIKLRTIILLRWGAIIGQLSALFVAQEIYGIDLEVGLCLLVVGISIIGNLVATVIFPESKRLSEAENLLMILFDLLQLSLLLFLTGGLNNPFYILLLGPVMVSAAVLTLRSTVFLGVTATIIVTILSKYHVPLRTNSGEILKTPELFLFGNWTAILIAIIFLSYYSRRIAVEMHSMSDALVATQMALSREQKLTDLGGVVAAAAHELGTPLATIKLVSAELIDELDDHPSLQEDARLIREQTDRCRDILRSMGRAGKDDLHLRTAPLTTLVSEAAEPHITRGKAIMFSHKSAENALLDPPIVRRSPEIIHGLRNLVQNAVDFSRSTVWVETDWSHEKIRVRILDNGKGYPPQVIGRIGDPFMSKRRRHSHPQDRPEYEGMGLGLFIAKTLLERTGAELSFANGGDPFLPPEEQPEKCGAVVEVVWSRHDIEAPQTALGENPNF